MSAEKKKDTHYPLEFIKKNPFEGSFHYVETHTRINKDGEEVEVKGHYRANRLDNDKTWKGAEGKRNTLKKRIRYWFTEAKEKGLTPKRVKQIQEANAQIKDMGGKPVQYRKYIKECGFED